MRELAAILLYILALCSSLGIQGGAAVEYPSVGFKVASATWKTYRDFVAELRELVKPSFDPKKCILPVLRPDYHIPVEERFVLANVTTLDGNTVSFAVDVVNLDVVAFSGVNSNRSYFFKDASQLQTDNLFVDTTQTKLAFSGNYNSLETVGEISRKSIPLGLNPLDLSATILWNVRFVADRVIANILIVVTQMVSEAAKFRYIEERVRRSISGETTFTPSGLIVSMEDQWSTMSLEVQRAFGGVFFSRSVLLQEDDTYSTIEVDNINTLSRYTMVAVLLDRCSQLLLLPPASAALNPIIRMPVDPDELCKVRETTRRISGRDGLCVDVRNGSAISGNFIQLWPCEEEQSEQEWTFHEDGTIRLQDKCMITFGYSPGHYVMIFDCSSTAPDATKWVVSIDGSITNPRSGLVLTAPEASRGTILLVENNTYEASQGWSVGNVEPLVTYIVGYNELCLQVDDEKTAVWLEECVIDRLQQRWALYGDGTIRVDSDRSLCVTSSGHSSSDLIVILKCIGSNNQRWVFNSTDLTILYPYAKLVMDVKESNVALREIILCQPTGNPNQQWLTPVRI